MERDKKQIEADIKILREFLQKHFYGIFTDDETLIQLGVYSLYENMRNVSNPPRVVEAAWRRLHILSECLSEEREIKEKEKKK
jgi:hypothetical protein